jgi:ABC-type uncharacterized transport system permease subunit
MRFRNSLIYIISFNFIFYSSAHAYLDPGTINIVLQSILAAIAGIAATYKIWLYKLKNILVKLNKKIRQDNHLNKK